MKKIITILVLCFLSQATQGQMNITTSESRCSNSGSITVSVDTFIVVGDSITCKITNTLNNAILINQVCYSNPFTFTNIAAGTYLVEVIHYGHSHFQTVVVSGNYHLPTLSVSLYPNTLIASISNGRPPFQYSISNSLSGPWSPWQTSNIFTECNGNYYIRVIDSCYVPIANGPYILNHPFTITKTVTDNATGLDQVVITPNTPSSTYTLTNNGVSITQPSPIFNVTLDSCPHQITAINNCGQTATSTFDIFIPNFKATVLCANFDNHSFTIQASGGSAPYTYTILTATGSPTAFSNQTGIFTNATPTGTYGTPDYYLVEIKDNCSRIIKPIVSEALYNASPHGCNFPNEYIIYGYNYIGSALPIGDLSDSDTNNFTFTCTSCTPQQTWNSSTRSLLLQNFTAGTYTFEITNQCGDVTTKNFTFTPASLSPSYIYLNKISCDSIQFSSDYNSISTYNVYNANNLSTPLFSNSTGVFGGLIVGNPYIIEAIPSSSPNSCQYPPDTIRYISNSTITNYNVSFCTKLLEESENCSSFSVSSSSLIMMNISSYYNSYLPNNCNIGETTFSLVSGGNSYPEVCRIYDYNPNNTFCSPCLAILYFLVPNSNFNFSSFQLLEDSTGCGQIVNGNNYSWPYPTTPIDLNMSLLCDGSYCLKYLTSYSPNFPINCYENEYNWCNPFQAPGGQCNFGMEVPNPNGTNWSINNNNVMFDHNQPYFYRFYDNNGNFLEQRLGGYDLQENPLCNLPPGIDSILTIRYYNYFTEVSLGFGSPSLQLTGGISGQHYYTCYINPVCGDSTWFKIPTPKTPTSSIQNIYVCGNSSNYNATVNITGNTSPYNLSLNQIISPTNFNISGPYTTSGPTYTFSGLSPGHYLVITSDDCRGSDWRFSIINNCSTNCDTNAISPAFSYQKICNKLIINNQTVGDTFNFIYNWKFGDGAISNFKNPTHTYSTAGVYTIKLIVQDIITGCKDSISQVITLSNLVVNITGSTICQGSSTTLTASGGTAYQWDSGETTESINVATAGNHCVTVSDANGCTASACQNIVIGSITASISGDTSICQGTSTTLTASGGTSYIWDSGETTASITVGMAGNHCVTVSNANGCTALACQNIIINQPLGIDLTRQAICAGDCTYIPAEIYPLDPNATYLWSNGETTAINYFCITSAGYNPYSVTVTSGLGCTSTASSNIDGYPTPIINLTGDTTVCSGTNTIIAVNSNTTNDYLWNNGSTSQSISVGVGTYCVTATNTSGCTASACITISDSLCCPPLNISINSNHANNDFCAGEQLCMTTVINGITNPTTGYTYQWYNATGGGWNPISIANGGTTPNPCKVLNQVGNFQFALVVTGSPEFCKDTIYIPITVHFTPIVNLGSDTTVCAGACVTFFSSKFDLEDYCSISWSSGNTPNSWTNTICGAGTYTLSATCDSLCTNVDTIVITELPPPVITITGNNVICGSSNTILTANGGASYLWSNGLSTKNITVGSGTYCVTATDANGCTGTACITVTSYPGLTLSETHINTCCYGQEKGNIDWMVSGGTAPYTWSNGPSLWSLGVGTFCTTVTDANGCSATSCVTLTQPTQVVISETHTNPNCFGSCNGTVHWTVTGGGGPYTWSNSTNQTGLCAGTYCNTVTDAHGCSVTKCITLSQPDALEVAIESDLDDNFMICAGSCINLTAIPSATPVTYLWSSGQTTVSINACPTVNTDYTVTISNATGCTATASISILVNPTPIVTIAQIETVNCCRVISATVTNCQSSNTISPLTHPVIGYLWSDGATTANLTICNPGLYCVTATCESGCTASACMQVTMPSPPGFTITGFQSVYCKGDIASACATPTNPSAVYTYEWFGYNGCNPATSVCGTPIVHFTSQCVTGSASLAGVFYYQVIATDPLTGCKDTVYIGPITVNPKPTVIIEGLNQTCQNAPVNQNANASGGTAPYSYTWYAGSTPTGTVVSTASTYSSAIGTYTVVVTDANGCTATATKTITLDPCCGFNITYTVNTCGTGYTFTATKGGVTPATASWTIDGGVPITGTQNPKTITGMSTGSHTVCATTTFTTGTGNQILDYQCTKCITVQVAPTYCDFTADFCTTITPTITGGVLNFGNTTPAPSTGITQTYNWSFSGGSTLTSTLSSGTVNYPTPGVYNVCLTVTRTCGGTSCSMTCCKQIIINTPCTLTANSEFNYLVNYSGTIPTVALSAVNIPTGATFAWTANGTVIGTSASMNYTPAVSGSYQICLTVAKGRACTKTICHTVLLNNKCNVKADFKSQWCKSAPLNINFALTSAIPSGATVTWDFGDSASGASNISNSINPTHTFSAAGSYKVCMTVSMGVGCSATTCYKVNVESPICNFKSNLQAQEVPEQTDMELLYQDAFKNEGIEIYPNPTTGEITVSHPSEIKQIDVFDLMGKHLIQFKTEGNSQSVLNLNNFPNGMYFIKIDGYEAKKIVKATE